MDDFISHSFLSAPPSWSQTNASERSPWISSTESHTNSLLGDSLGSERSPWISSTESHTNSLLGESLGSYGGDEKTSNICMISSNHIIENTSVEQPVLKIHGESIGSELNSSCQVSVTTNEFSRKSSELSGYSQSVGYPYSSGMSTLISTQGNVQGLSLESLDCGAAILANGCIADGQFLEDPNELSNSHFNSFFAQQQTNYAGNSGSSQHQQEQLEVHNFHVPSFAVEAPMSMTRHTEIQTEQQSFEGQRNTQPHSIMANANGCNGAVKLRVRARRGQATDPHSIAERLRREKIAERMKNLQELVPNSNKTDKASMLDEIIEYVKFLQLQVKVLSMSRLGAAGAVVPLLTDSQSEGSGGLHLSASSESQANLAFEQEVVKLMESNVTSAMQFLQNKGLCLMPIALASAISSHKGQSVAIPRQTKKSDVCTAVVKQEDAVKTQTPSH